MEEGSALTTEAESSLRLREREVVSAENRLSGQSNSAGKGDVAGPGGRAKSTEKSVPGDPTVMERLPSPYPGTQPQPSTEFWGRTQLGGGKSEVSFHQAAQLLAPLL